MASVSARVRASEAIAVLARISEPGYQFSNPLLQQLYGITAEQAEWLRAFAKRNNVLITLRTRGADVLRWGAEAFLKPEEIKLKTVNWVDVEYLDYGDDIGRLVIREPIPIEALKAQLRAEGWAQGSARYRDVMDRYLLRVKEWQGEAQKLRLKARTTKTLDLEFNWNENLVDTSAVPRERTTVGLRMTETKRRPGVREWVVEVDPDLSGNWRSVVGDLDVVSLTDLVGRALPQDLHVKLVNLLRAGPLKSPHAETGSWMKKGQFWFRAKAEQMMRVTSSGDRLHDVQFGGDGAARAVFLDLARSVVQGKNVDADNYLLKYLGGYVHATP